MAADPPPSHPGPAPVEGPRGMLALGATLGAGIWWSEQLFAVAGGWVPSVPEASVRVHLAELSRVVGDHAVALRCHLPRPAPVDPEGWVVPPNGGAAAVVDGLAAPAGSAARLAGVHRVLVPRLLVTWRAVATAGTVVDRGVARTAGHVHADLLDLWHDGEGLLQALVGAGGDAGALAASTAAEVEVNLVTAGGHLPPSPTVLPG